MVHYRDLLETVIPGWGSDQYRMFRRRQRGHGTHASTQHMKAKLINGPPYGIAPRAKDTTIDVRTMTARYAEVASIVNIPV